MPQRLLRAVSFDDTRVQRLVKQWLTPGGLYMVNLIDGTQHDFLRAYVHTLQQTFHSVYVAPTSENWRESPRMTFVLIATGEALSSISQTGDRCKKPR
jgi:hypothetical protein